MSCVVLSGPLPILRIDITLPMQNIGGGDIVEAWEVKKRPGSFYQPSVESQNIPLKPNVTSQPRRKLQMEAPGGPREGII